MKMSQTIVLISLLLPIFLIFGLFTFQPEREYAPGQKVSAALYQGDLITIRGSEAQISHPQGLALLASSSDGAKYGVITDGHYEITNHQGVILEFPPTTIGKHYWHIVLLSLAAAVAFGLVLSLVLSIRAQYFHQKHIEVR